MYIKKSFPLIVQAKKTLATMYYESFYLDG